MNREEALAAIEKACSDFVVANPHWERAARTRTLVHNSEMWRLSVVPVEIDDGPDVDYTKPRGYKLCYRGWFVRDDRTVPTEHADSFEDALAKIKMYVEREVKLLQGALREL